MKNPIVSSIVFSLLCLSVVACKSSPNDSVIQAEAKNDKTKNLVSKNVAQFMVEMSDARMMDHAEGELAAERGTTPMIRKYGKKMVDDQQMLLGELKTLAQKNHVDLPQKISDEKQSGLNDLNKLKGKKFDKQFLSMIQIDHERDVSQFKAVTADADYSADKEVTHFAAQRLPMIEQHLNEVKAIRKKTKN